MKIIKQIEKVYLENLQNNKLYLEEDQWQHLAHSSHLSKKDFLFTILDFAKNFSHTPISNFQVGVAALGISNKLYLGTNAEFVGFPLNQSIHAEQSLISMMYAQEEKGIKEIYMSAFPCGHCRQFMREIFNYKEIKIYSRLEKEKEFLFPELLPYSFGSQDLNVDDALFSHFSQTLVTKVEDTIGINEKIKQKLLHAVQQSFAPYTKNPSGILLEFDDSALVSGSYLESCAYNPSLSPFHMAYTQIAFFQRNLKNVKAVYFAEMAAPSVVHAQNIEALVQKLMPQAKFYILKAV